LNKKSFIAEAQRAQRNAEKRRNEERRAKEFG
jgi:hypothetical protein